MLVWCKNVCHLRYFIFWPRIQCFLKRKLVGAIGKKFCSLCMKGYCSRCISFQARRFQHLWRLPDGGPALGRRLGSCTRRRTLTADKTVFQVAEARNNGADLLADATLMSYAYSKLQLQQVQNKGIFSLRLQLATCAVQFT